MPKMHELIEKLSRYHPLDVDAEIDFSSSVICGIKKFILYCLISLFAICQFEYHVYNYICVCCCISCTIMYSYIFLVYLATKFQQVANAQ